jgi:PAS domain S-box-containing protein
MRIAYRKYRAHVLRFAALFAAFVFAMIALESWQNHERAIAAATRESGNLARALEEHTLRTVQAVDNALVTLGQHQDSDIAGTTLGPRTDEKLDARLKQMLVSLPQLSALSILNSRGKIVVSSTPDADPTVDFSGQDFFVAARTGLASHVFIGAPFRSPILGTWVIGMARPILKEDGQFSGVAFAAINPAYFADIYRAIDSGPNGNVTLFRRDGLILARWPAPEAFIGKSVAMGDLFRKYLPKEDAGSVRLHTVIGDRDFILSYRAVGSMPLVIHVAFDEDDVLAGWRSTLVSSCVLAIGAALLIGLATSLLLRAHQSSLALAAQSRATQVAKAAEAATAQHRQTLAISEERFALAMRGSSDGIWDWAIVTGEAYFSERFLELLGYWPEGLAATMDAWRALIHPADLERVRRGEHHHLEFCELYDVDMRLRVQSGEYRWFRARGQAVWNESGQPIRMAGSLTDVAALKHSQQILRDSELRLNQAQHIARVGSWELNLGSGELLWSDEIFSIFEVEKQKFGATFEAFLNLIHPDDLDLVKEAYENSLVTRIPYEIAHRLRMSDGRIKWVNERCETLFDEKGTALRSVGVVQDVSDLKRAQDELVHHKARLEELVAQRTAELQLAQRIGRMGNWVMMLEFPSLTWSDEIFRICGYEPGAFTPSKKILLTILHPDERNEVLKAIENAITNRLPYSIDHRIVLPTGEVRWAHQEARNLCNANDVVVGLAGTIQDITERKFTEQSLIEARLAAEAANLAKSSFLSSMSHELRTPLNALLGYAQLLTMDENTSQETLENAAEIEKAGRHLLSLVNDILDLARIESGTMEINIEDVTLAEVLEDCRRLIGPMAQAHGIQLVLPPQVLAVVLRADRTRLAQALLNLLSNAIKYNGEGGRVSVDGATQARGHYRISVTDTGAGLTSERVGALFQPFNRLGAERGHIEGTGIGLAITKALVEAMHGALGVASVPGRGSSFWIDLPLA